MVTHRGEAHEQQKDFFADFLAGFFLLNFVGKSAQKFVQENPRENRPKFIQQNPRHISAEGPGQLFWKLY